MRNVASPFNKGALMENIPLRDLRKHTRHRYCVPGAQNDVFRGATGNVGAFTAFIK